MELNPLFDDGMVLQARQPLRVFGKGAGTVEVRFCGQCAQSQPDGQDGWMVVLDAVEPGGPFTMEILSAGECYLLQDIMVGQVILCAGQSNMQFTLQEEPLDHSADLDDTLLRTFVPDRPEQAPGLKSADGWVKCTAASAPDWSAIGYHLGRLLRQKTGMPVGILGSYQGASALQSWLPKEVATKPEYDVPKQALHPDHTDANYGAWNPPGTLHECMTLHLAPFSVGSVVWYQGESNTSDAEAKLYDKMLEDMIGIWRKLWHLPQLPFVLVQICDYADREDAAWHEVQRRQRMVADRVPQVCLVTSSDVCTHENIHPPLKKALADKIFKALEAEAK